MAATPKKLPPLPSVGDLIRIYRLSSIKQLSQNFILDLNITGILLYSENFSFLSVEFKDKIVRGAGKQIEGGTVIEVGPGPGSLTRSLLKHGVKKLIAVEKDRRFKPALETLSDAYGGRLKVK